MRSTSIVSAFSLSLALTACGAGQYGFSRTYVPLDEESELLERVTPVNYEDVKRDPAEYRASMLSWFGVVTGVEAVDSGRARVALSFRTHQERHLCRDETDGSCRVTVSERSSGAFTAVLSIRDEDRHGAQRLWVGSLLRIYGSPTGEFAADGGPILEVRHYRHWPRGYYATTAARSTMRR